MLVQLEVMANLINHGEWGVAVDSLGPAYVADENNSRIRKISTDGFVSTLAGNGSLGFRNGENAKAMFWYPNSVAVDSLGVVYVADYRNNRIRKISNGNLSTLAGNGVRGQQDLVFIKLRIGILALTKWGPSWARLLKLISIESASKEEFNLALALGRGR